MEHSMDEKTVSYVDITYYSIGYVKIYKAAVKTRFLRRMLD